jgi:hypothetical protein
VANDFAFRPAVFAALCDGQSYEGFRLSRGPKLAIAIACNADADRIIRAFQMGARHGLGAAWLQSPVLPDHPMIPDPLPAVALGLRRSVESIDRRGAGVAQLSGCVCN